jgi:type IV secretion system protein VirB10
MKNNLDPKKQIESSSDNIEVKQDGPSIASGKKGKAAIIIASVVLTGLIVHIMFFKTEQKSEKLEEIETPKISQVAPSDTGKSPFELDVSEIKKAEDNQEIIDKPLSPEIPSLPELPVNTTIPAELSLSPLQNNNEQKNNQINSGTENFKQSDSTKKNDKESEKPINPRYAPIVVFGTNGESGAQKSVGYDENIVSLKKSPIDELKKTENQIEANLIPDMIHTIAQGKMLNAILETAINTEIPGSVRAIVNRDVYGELGNEILIPKGSRLYGSYSSEIKRGQGRVQINWSRLIRPDGVSLNISFAASDQFGRAGISGDVDNRYSSIVVNSVLTSVLAIGGVSAAQKLLNNNTATTVVNNPVQGTTTTTGNASNQVLYDMTKSILDIIGQIITNAIDMNAVIRVPQGTRITVIVNSDMIIPSIKRK